MARQAERGAPRSFYLHRTRAAAGFGSAPAQARPRGTSGSRLAMCDVCANPTAGLRASATAGLDGRLEFDSSNHGLC
jgi:hypothetical protein